MIIIRTLKELAELKSYLTDKEYIAFDTETDGVDKSSRIIGFSVCAEVDLAYYVILAYWDVSTQTLNELETEKEAKALLTSLIGKGLIMQNAGFDCYMVQNNYQVNLMPSVHTDTMILAHILNENRAVGLKELGVAIFGEDARKEQLEMKESVTKNGGVLTKEKYELYKADAELIALYGAKDAILTLKLFYLFIEDLYEQSLDDFFYNDESMPLLKGPTYDLNTTGLRVDPEQLETLKRVLEVESLEAKGFIDQEIKAHIAVKYPGTSKAKTFNIGAPQQRAWLLYEQLGNEFNNLTKSGKDLCKALNLKLPYTIGAKKDFIYSVTKLKGKEWVPVDWVPKRREGDALTWWNPKDKKVMKTPKKVGDPWQYMACGKESLGKLSNKYKWVAKLLEYSKSMKLAATIEGIQEKVQYGIIRPSFLQHGTTSGRYSSKRPNFQNLPRDDKRLKACIISRPGKVFVGADYSQLEPRVFASFSKDERLLKCFKDKDDFYSVIGAAVFKKYDCSLKKDDKNSFAKLYPKLRDISKVVALSATYGTTAPKMAPALNMSIQEAQEVIDDYFEAYPSVKEMMLSFHSQAKTAGEVKNLYGRKRRIPKALDIPKIYGKNTAHADLPYEARNILNLAVNHPIQSTGASIMNRAAIACWKACRALEELDKAWAEVKIVLQVHDELILEGPEHLKEDMVLVLKDAMENTTTLPGVDLIADPRIAYNLADLK